MNVKDHIRGIARFEYFRDSSLWYRTESNLLFPVPISDTGTATFPSEEKAMFFMRWIRKYLAEVETA